MPRRLALAALPLVLIVALLSACTESTRIPPAEPPSATQPLFASDEEALEAATAAYEEYLAASNLVTSSPDLDIDPIEALVTSEYLANELMTLEVFSSGGLRTKGESRLRSSALQQFFEEETGAPIVVIYVCLDVSGVLVLDSTGVDVTPPDRAETALLEVELRVEPAISESLLIHRSEPWKEATLCD